MDRQTAYDQVVQTRLIAVLRGQFPPATALDVASTLISAGITVLEFTTNSPHAVAALQAVKAAYGAESCVGMGTVLDQSAARRALDAGADFIVAPTLDPAVVEVAHNADRLAIPGALTPNEAVAAAATGAKIVKLFPVGALGVDYFRFLRGPLNHIDFCCNGGITDANIGAFLRAGAVACGVGAWLTGTGTLSADTMAQRARVLRRLADEASGNLPPQQMA
ncbi:MAG: bifunctional 4-hydroxy-2-oxoglutarate aldolase/2-dehydro-3-deoxy-phosphogluconate aldolase [Chloroflexi bacterium]|nr:bifunctional 4-hydroxy-2-oxoglutarate aldolase/2-dehydro-3-deoxy-phosphogluconate aldolase [Chloroflexota bacterium]